MVILTSCSDSTSSDTATSWDDPAAEDTFPGLRDRPTTDEATSLTALATGGKLVDWPQWRGPFRDGTTTESLPDRTDPRRLWKVELGPGISSVAVKDGRLYSMGYVSGKDVIYCLDAATGDEIWHYQYPCGRYANNHEGGPAATPAVDDEAVYTLSREAHLHCLDAKTGEVLWEKQLGGEFGVRRPQWAFAGSPVLLGDQVIVDVGRTIALNKRTGERIWATKDYTAAYSTPMPFSIGSRDFLAVFNGYGLVVLDRRGGTEISKMQWKTDYGINAATPVIVNDQVFITSAYNKGCAMVKVAGGELPVVWKSKKMRSKMATPVFWQGHLYGFDEMRLRCLDATTGKELWSQRGLGQGTVILAGDKLVVMSDKGELLIAGVGPEGFRPSTRMKVLSGTCWTAPVVAGGRIYCRNNNGTLVCLGW